MEGEVNSTTKFTTSLSTVHVKSAFGGSSAKVSPSSQSAMNASEMAQKVMDASRDLENYADQMGEDDFTEDGDVTSRMDTDAELLEEPFDSERAAQDNPDGDVPQTEAADNVPDTDRVAEPGLQSGVE